MFIYLTKRSLYEHKIITTIGDSLHTLSYRLIFLNITKRVLRNFVYVYICYNIILSYNGNISTSGAGTAYPSGSTISPVFSGVDVSPIFSFVCIVLQVIVYPCVLFPLIICIGCHSSVYGFWIPFKLFSFCFENHNQEYFFSFIIEIIIFIFIDKRIWILFAYR